MIATVNRLIRWIIIDPAAASHVPAKISGTPARREATAPAMPISINHMATIQSAVLIRIAHETGLADDSVQ